MLLIVHNKPSDLFIAFHFVASAFIVNVLYGAFSTSEKWLKRKTLDPLTWLPKQRIVPQRSVVARVGAGALSTPCILKQLESLFNIIVIV